MFGKEVSELQTGVAVANGAITGELYYVEGYTGFSSNPAQQDGNFLALDFADNTFTGLTSVKVGLVPTYVSGEAVNDDSGLVEIINDDTKDGVFKITNGSQIFKIVSTDGTRTNTQTFSLSGLTLDENE